MISYTVSDRWRRTVAVMNSDVTCDSSAVSWLRELSWVAVGDEDIVRHSSQRERLDIVI